MSAQLLNKEEYETLNKEEKEKYDFAMRHINDDWAMGPWGGWSRAHDALKEIGWTEKRINKGYREFISLVKPKRFADLEALGAQEL